MARYALIEAGVVVNVIEADAAFAVSVGAVPAPGASPGDLYNAGTFSAPPVPPPVPPRNVTRRQARHALLDAGLLDAVDAAIDALPDGPRQRAQIDWQDAADFDRDNPTLLLLASALGLDAVDLDALFIQAAGL